MFVTDQQENRIIIYNKHNETYRGFINLHNNVPYDILMYDDRYQPSDGTGKDDREDLVHITFNCVIDTTPSLLNVDGYTCI